MQLDAEHFERASIDSFWFSFQNMILITHKMSLLNAVTVLWTMTATNHFHVSMNPNIGCFDSSATMNQITTKHENIASLKFDLKVLEFATGIKANCSRPNIEQGS